jgi:hypothetical protein
MGFAASAVFSSLLHLERAAFVAAYGVVGGAFVFVYLSTTGIDPVPQLQRRWGKGIVGGLVFGILRISGVTRQPGSAVPHGRRLVFALAWIGLVYGIVDAILLNVVPVLMVYSTRQSSVLRNPRRDLSWSLWALAASLFVTALYHIGFAEFRGPGLLQPAGQCDHYDWLKPSLGDVAGASDKSPDEHQRCEDHRPQNRDVV